MNKIIIISLKLIKLIFVLLLIISFTPAQNIQSTSKTDTINVREKNSDLSKFTDEFKPMSLTYLKMSSPLSNFSLNSNALYYSQSLVLPSQFNVPNNLPVVADFLSPLRPRINPSEQTVKTILHYVGTAAAIGVAAFHVNKYWKEYKRDLGVK